MGPYIFVSFRECNRDDRVDSLRRCAIDQLENTRVDVPHVTRSLYQGVVFSHRRIMERFNKNRCRNFILQVFVVGRQTEYQ